MSKFNVGDIITGKKNSNDRYSITTDKAKMEVINVIEEGAEIDIEVKVIKHYKDSYQEGRTFSVDSTYFRPLNNNVRRV